VAAPIRVGILEVAEASDLAEALAVRGLIGRPVAARGKRWVEIHEPHEEEERLLAEVKEAVEAWLADRGHPAVEIRVGDRSIAVKAPERLDDALRERLPTPAEDLTQRP
jgi:hypothetical protein